MEKTIRDIIKEKSEKLRQIDSLGPHEAAEELVELTSLMASLNAHISECQFWLNIKKLECLKEHGTASKAKIHAEASNEWKAFNDAKMQSEALMEIVRAVKYFLRNQESEMKL